MKGGLEELGRTAPSRAQEREEQFGIFPFYGTLPVIAKENGASLLYNSSALIHIDLPEVKYQAPEETETDHDSEGADVCKGAPEYNEDSKNQKNNQDNHTPADIEILLGATSGNKYLRSGSKKKSNQ